MNSEKKYIILIILIAFFGIFIKAQNPIIRNQFTADPSARVFNGKVYVFPSHDIPAPDGKGLRKDWFCMEDYHVFSSDNLTDWEDHGIIVSQYQVPWADSNAYSMWAPDCIEKNGKYYFYFPTITNKIDSTIKRKLFSVGVAISDKPEGPYKPLPEPIKGIMGIDPCVFIDKDGQAYLYWSMGNIYVAKLKSNMIELDSKPMIIENLPQKGLKEGPWVFERNGLYYLTFPHVENQIERLEYAIGDNPMGPFKMTGVIMDESPMNCWTNHHSIIEYKGQWYLFYHQNHLSPKFDKNRSICIDSLFFNEDGTIVKVTPTNRGVGLSDPFKPIQIDRYSSISEKNVKIEFVDSTNTFTGWKAIFDEEDAFIRYDAIDFGNKKIKSVKVKALSQSGSIIQIRLDKVDGTLLSEIKIPAGNNWNIVNKNLLSYRPGIHNLVVVAKNENPVEIDWICFE
jgi:hypothetical protein